MPTLCCNKNILIAVVLIEKHEHTLQKCFSYLDFLSCFQPKYQKNIFFKKILNQEEFSRQVKIIVLF